MLNVGIAWDMDRASPHSLPVRLSFDENSQRAQSALRNNHEFDGSTNAGTNADLLDEPSITGLLLRKQEALEFFAWAGIYAIIPYGIDRLRRPPARLNATAKRHHAAAADFPLPAVGGCLPR